MTAHHALAVVAALAAAAAAVWMAVAFKLARRLSAVRLEASAHRCPRPPGLEIRVMVEGCSKPVFQATANMLSDVLFLDGMDMHYPNLCTGRPNPCRHWVEFMSAGRMVAGNIRYEFRRISYDSYGTSPADDPQD